MSKLKRLLLNILLFPVFGGLSALVGNTIAETGYETPELVNTFYDKVALKSEKPFVILAQFAVKSKNIPKYAGDDVQWWKPLPIPVTGTNTGGLEDGVSPTAVKLEFQNVKAEVKSYGHLVAVSEFLGLTSIDPELKSKVQSLGVHRGKVIDQLYWLTLVENLYPMRIETNAAYECSDTVETDGSNSTSVVFDSVSGITNSTVGVIVMTSGNNKGMGGLATWTDAGTKFTISSTVPSYILNEAPVITDTYKFASSTDIDSGNPLTCAAAAKSVVILQSNHAVPMADGYYVGVLSPFTQYDIRNDSAFVNADQYAGSKKLYNGELGEWGGIRWVLDTIPWRSAAGTMQTYSASGAVFHTPIFGQECYAGVGIEGVQDRIIIHTKKQTGDNLEMYSTAGWKAYFVAKVLNACWGVQIISGATSVS